MVAGHYGIPGVIVPYLVESGAEIELVNVMTLHLLTANFVRLMDHTVQKTTHATKLLAQVSQHQDEVG